LVAARILGHDYIGIEISKEYVEFAINRLKNYEGELKFYNEEIDKHFVLKTFEERKKRGEFTGKYGPQNRKYKVADDECKEMDLFYYMKNEKTKHAKPT